MIPIKAIGIVFVVGSMFCFLSADSESQSISGSDSMSSVWSGAGRWSDVDFSDVDAQRHYEV